MQKSYASNIMDALASEPDFSTFVGAIKAADLTDTLKGAGPFTVFAPNNDAFNKLPQTTLQDMLKPQNKQQLIQIMNNHILQGRFASQDLMARANMGRSNQPQINQPQVAQSRGTQSQGGQNLATQARSSQPQSGQPQSNPTLGGQSQGGQNQATQARGTQSQGGMAGGMAQGGQSQGVMQLKTLQGSQLKLTTRGNILMVGNARIIQADVMCSNGIIHVIDTVMMPQMAGSSQTP